VPVSAFVSRFANLNDEEFDALLETRLSTNTKHIIQSATATVFEYARSKGKRVSDVEQMPAAELNKFLRRFYAEARKSDGSMYARKSLLSIRYGIA